CLRVYRFAIPVLSALIQHYRYGHETTTDNLSSVGLLIFPAPYIQHDETIIYPAYPRRWPDNWTSDNRADGLPYWPAPDSILYIAYKSTGTQIHAPDWL